MKVAHLDADLAAKGTIKELLERARSHEAQGEYDRAIKIYTGIIKKKPLNEMAYNRLMILYRKLKDYQKEITIIDQAIDSFESEANGVKKLPADKVGKLSLSLGKLTGLIDKKGRSLYDPEPVASWKKRKILSQKRLKTKKK
jgi:tetratricopeptide (TPR) repeat protein